jgi:hypothetical protein
MNVSSVTNGKFFITSDVKVNITTGPTLYKAVIARWDIL